MREQDKQLFRVYMDYLESSFGPEYAHQAIMKLIYNLAQEDYELKKEVEDDDFDVYEWLERNDDYKYELDNHVKEDPSEKHSFVIRRKVGGKIIFSPKMTRGELLKFLNYFFDIVETSKESDFTYYVK
jgi:hypothetical protein